MVLGEVGRRFQQTTYGAPRYLLGGQLDSDEYPFRDAIRFLLGESMSLIMDRIETIVENYPPQVLRILMNHIGTHDTERAFDGARRRTGGQPRPRVAKCARSPTLARNRFERMRFAAFCGLSACRASTTATSRHGGLPRSVQRACYRGDTKTRTLSHGTAASACCGRSTATF